MLYASILQKNLQKWFIFFIFKGSIDGRWFLFNVLKKWYKWSQFCKRLKYFFGARKVQSFLKDFHGTCEIFICLWKELLLLCQSLNWSFIWQNPSLQHDIKSALEFRMSHLGGFHSKVAMRFFSMAKCILILICANLGMTAFLFYTNLTFQSCLMLTLYYFHCFYIEACFMFHQLKWKTHKTALSRANEWKIFDWVVRQFLNRLKIGFHTERDPDCDTGSRIFWTKLTESVS